MPSLLERLDTWLTLRVLHRKGEDEAKFSEQDARQAIRECATEFTMMDLATYLKAKTLREYVVVACACANAYRDGELEQKVRVIDDEGTLLGEYKKLLDVPETMYHPTTGTPMAVSFEEHVKVIYRNLPQTQIVSPSRP